MTSDATGTLTELAFRAGSRRAIVIGAGIGGLLAARVLADHVDSVLVLDRDSLPDAPAHRKNTPQGQHVHALLSRGRAVIETLLPGITSELVTLGAIQGDFRHDLTWFQNGGYLHDSDIDLTPLMVSRPLLEHHLRHRVGDIQNVAIIDGCQVAGLLATRDRQRVTGVRCSDAAGVERELAADFVVDASGRGSRLPAWLEQLGYGSLETVVAGAESRYATRSFRRSPGTDRARLATVIVASPALRRGGVMVAQEGDRWLVSLASRNGPQPPTALPDFIAFAASLEVPDIYQAIRHAEPLDDGAIFRFPRSQRRLFEKMDRFPEGLLPMADAICSFNPVYGQGMSIAAIEAELLQRCLGEGEVDLARRFFAGISAPLDSVWKMTNSGDLRYADEPVKLSRPVRFMGWYLDHLLVAARSDAVVAGAYHRVTNLVDMPTALLRPAIASRVLLRGNRERAAQPSSPTEAPEIARSRAA